MTLLSNLLSDGYIGNTGATGSTGPIGYTGSVGATGATGYTGATGATGIQGYTGSEGATGATGYIGSVGATGSTGVIGYTGSIGSTGATGIQGASGSTGTIGYTGSVGSTGVIGYTGSIGATGATGTIGYTGSIGSTGPIGYTGSAGAQQTLNGLTFLLATDETASTEITSSVVESAAHKTYSLAANTYSNIIIEAIVVCRNNQDANNSPEFTWRFKTAGVTSKTIVLRNMGSNAAGADSGDTMVSTISAVIAGGQVSTTALTLTSQMTVSNAAIGSQVIGWKVYGVRDLTISAGPIGATGAGFTGSIGATGIQGPTGGASGPQGYTGSIGATGVSGASGATGVYELPLTIATLAL